jgi:putative hemolysin
VGVGELVPKQLALRAADTVAVLAAGPMALIARVVGPFVWLLDRSSALLLRLLGVRDEGAEKLTAEELQMVFVEAERSGVIEEDERAMMAGIMRMADRPVRELMTPRTELDWIELATSGDDLRDKLVGAAHSLLPVGEGSPDTIVGVLPVRGALRELLGGGQPSIATLMRRAEVIPDQLDSMDALRIMQQSEVAMALVHDEYGHFEGVVTPADLLSAIAGGFASHQDIGDDPLMTEREDGSLLISGAMAADALAQRLVIELSDDREYATAAGYVLSVLKRLPKEGEHFADQGWRFEIIDMDGLKIDKLLVSREVVGAEAG